MINFTNPEPMADETISLDFSDIATSDFNKEPEKEVLKVEEPKEGADSLKVEMSENEPEEIHQSFTTVVNSLADLGIITEPYEGFNDEEDATEETLVKLLEHNIAKKAEESVDTLLGSLSDYSRRIIEFDLNSKNKAEIEPYLKTLIEEHNIKSLTTENEYDQEKILREWYRNKEGFTPDELNEKLSNLKEAGLLEKEAKLIKPKLDKIAEEIAKGKETEQRERVEFEQKVKAEFSERVISSLKTGKIGNISLDKESAANLYSTLTDEEIEVTIHGGKKVMMSPLEAYIFHHKYSSKGSLETLALATLLLTNPKKFEEQYSKVSQTKEAEKFVKEHKYSNVLKRGNVPAKIEETKNTSKYKVNWNLPQDMRQ
jgi:hypothetical protein